MIIWKYHAPKMSSAKSLSDMQVQMQPYEGASKNLYLVVQMPPMKMQMRFFMHVMQVFVIVASINSLRSWILIITSHESFFSVLMRF